MSANDILDVLNINREDAVQPAKKKQKVEQPIIQKGGLARELYNLLGPNTPPVNVNMGISRIKDRKQRVSPWTRMPFIPTKLHAHPPILNHWQKGSRDLLEQQENKPYAFERFNASIDIPEFVDEEAYNNITAIIVKEEETLAAAEVPTSSKEKSTESTDEKSDSASATSKTDIISKSSQLEKKEPRVTSDWSYEETKLLFELCKDFELKWIVVHDRFPGERSLEELKDQFYKVTSQILKQNGSGNPTLVESLDAYSRAAEEERKSYLESLLRRTPAEIAEEESLVIEARRFELAAKKMLMERAHLLTLLDSPQTSQSVQQFQSSQGLTNLYNNLMILDKHQKKKQQQRSALNDPVPPPIPLAASSSHRRDKTFQTHLQQYLAGIVKLLSSGSLESSAIQQLLSKRLTAKEEEAYGLCYHSNERLTPGVILRSTQKLSGLQQRQSVFKSVNGLLQELDIPTGGGTTWRPVMPTQKTMVKFDELIRSSVALLDLKKGKDKLEAEIELIKSQRGL